jgi:hypothetical protein
LHRPVSVPGAFATLGVLALVVFLPALPPPMLTHPMALPPPWGPGPRWVPLPTSAPAHLAAPARVVPGPGQLTGEGRLVVTTADGLAFPNDGLRVNLTAFPPSQFPSDASFQVAVEETIGGYDAVFGLFENSVFPVVPFFSVFSNSTNQPMHLAYWTDLTLLSGTAYDFELQPWNGTLWQLTVNGLRFGENTSQAQFDFNATESTWVGGMSFSEIALYPSLPTAPPVMTASLTFATHRPSGWYLPTSATTLITAPTGSAWGIAGRLQNPVLAPGTTVSGTSVPAPGNGTDLWTGGPVAIGVSLTTPASAVSLTAVSLSLRTSTVTGAALPGVAVAVADALGGSFTPGGLITNSAGSAGLAFETPNVSAPTPDLVTVRVTTFGYVGSTGVNVTLTPAAEVILVPDGGTNYLPPGGVATVGWTAFAANHSVLPGILVTFSASSGTLDPEFATSGPGGHLSTTLNGTLVRSGFVNVVAIVATAGTWGRNAINVTIGAPPSPAAWAVFVEPAIVAAIALLVAATLFVAWKRRPKTPLPPMALPRRRRFPPPGAPPAGPTRTPPSTGGP